MSGRLVHCGIVIDPRGRKTNWRAGGTAAAANIADVVEVGVFLGDRRPASSETATKCWCRLSSCPRLRRR